MLPGSGFVILDTGVTPELQSEGVARDVVRAVQQARREYKKQRIYQEKTFKQRDKIL